jgi:organic hydroperoxide reductase OsmC/OhrA
VTGNDGNLKRIGANAMAHPDEVEVSIELQQGYQFLADFHMDGVPPLMMDEPAPLGAGQGPNAARVLAAAVADCLSASALFCLRKAHVAVKGMRTSASASLVRDERGRLRVGTIRVKIQPEVDSADISRIGRCLELFEDYCVVTQSVRSGLDVSVEVEPATVG